MTVVLKRPYTGAQPTAGLVTPTVDSPFGKVIPLVLGTATVESIPIYVSSPRNRELANQPGNSVQLVDFAVVVGFSDPTASHVIVTRMWDDGQIFYDATGRTAITTANYNFTVYPGNEQQGPDPILSKALGSTAPAFRGLIYIVFNNYVVRSGSDGKLPQILVEVKQTQDVKLTYQPLLGAIYGDHVYYETDEETDEVVYYGPNGIDIFSASAGIYLYSLPLVSPLPNTAISVAGVKALITPSNELDHYYAICDAPGTYTYSGFIAYINKRTNVIEGYLPAPGSTTNWHFANHITAVAGVGQWDEYLVMCYGNALTLYGRKGATISYIKALSSNAAGTWTLAAEGPTPSYNINWQSWQYWPRPSLADIKNDANTLSVAYHTAKSFPGQPDDGNIALNINYDDVPSSAFLDTTGGDPTVVCPIVDTSGFAVFYAVLVGGSTASVYRYILTDGASVDVAYSPSNIPPYTVMVSCSATINQKGQQYPNDNYSGNRDIGFDIGNKHYATGADYYINEYVDYVDTYSPPTFAADSSTVTPYGAPYTTVLHPVDANNPAIVRTQTGDGGARVAQFTVPAHMAVAALFPGPIENPFLSVALAPSGTSAGTNGILKTFDTYWTRRNYSADQGNTTGGNTGVFQNNFVVAALLNIAVNGSFSDGSSVNLGSAGLVWRLRDAVFPMTDALFNFAAPYGDVALTGFPNLTTMSQCGMNMLQQRTGYRYDTQDLSWASGDMAYIADMYTGVVQSYGGVGFENAGGVTIQNPMNDTVTIDPQDGLILMARPPGEILINGGVAIGDVSLGTILSGILLHAGIDAGSINQSGLTGISVRGAVINETVQLTDLMTSLAQVFIFDYFDSNGKINLVKKPRNVLFAFDGTIYEEGLLPLNDGNADDGSIIKYERAEPSNTPYQLSLEYLDQDYNCTVGTQVAKRTLFPYRTVNTSQPVDLSVPVVMSANDAAYWANAALYDQWAALTTWNMRLDLGGMEFDPGDNIKFVRLDGSFIALRVSQCTLNGDKSTSIQCQTMSLYDGFSTPSGPTPAYASTQSLTRAVPPVWLCPDNILVNPADEDDASSIVPYRWASNQAAALYLKGAGAATYTLFSSSPTPAISGTVLQALPKLPARFTPHVDYSASFDFIPSAATSSKMPELPTDDIDAVSGKYMMFVGAPGRWEMLYYGAVTYDKAHNKMTVTGLVRARRGSDVAANLHQAGDTVFFAPPSFTSFDLGFSLKTAQEIVQVLASGGGTTQTPTVDAIPVVGMPLVPWSPCHIKAAVSGSDIVFTWVRRTRAADNLHDGDALITADEPTIGFVITILKSDGVTTRTITVNGDAGTATYTAAMITADGFASTPQSVSFAIQQISSQMPRTNGWPATRNNYTLGA